MIQISFYWFLKFFDSMVVNSLDVVFQTGAGEANHFTAPFLAPSHFRVSRVGPKLGYSVMYMYITTKQLSCFNPIAEQLNRVFTPCELVID